MNTAEKLIKDEHLQFEPSVNGFCTDCEITVVTETLDNFCSRFETLCNQSVWIFNDDSYITVNDDQYFFDDDVTEFELIDSEWKHQGKSFSFENL